MPSTANIHAAVNARQNDKFDEMVGKSLYSVNYKFPDNEVRVLPQWLFHYLRKIFLWCWRIRCNKFVRLFTDFAFIFFLDTTQYLN